METGRIKFKKRKNIKSGFNACIADLEHTNDLMKEVHEFLLKCMAHNISFMSSEIEAELDIGIGVGSNDQFAPSLGVQLEDMQLLVRLGLELRVSTYPCSDDE